MSVGTVKAQTLPQRRGRRDRVIAAGDWVWRQLNRISRKRILACILIGLFPVAARLAVLRWVPPPQPTAHDEFSYLLGADTFASGRITNPTPKMWMHFETFHEIFQPTYTTKYAPAQPLTLALGQMLFGHPWYGVVISFGLMAACLCWMLQGWVPPIYAVLGTLMAIGQIGIYRYWMDSYWGGAVPAAAGCLVLGAVPRLARRATVLPTLAATIGLMVLANSRPFEGLVAAGAGFVGLLWWRRRKRLPLKELARPACVVVFVAVCGAAFAGMGYYNYRVTGNALTMPYMIYYRQYFITTQYFYLAPVRSHPPVYRHEALRQFFVDADLQDYYKARRNIAFPLYHLYTALRFFFSPLIVLGFAAGAILSRSRRVGLAIGIAGVVLLAIAFEISSAAHYYAPAVGAFVVPVAAALCWLKRAGRTFGPLLVLVCVAAPFTQAPFELVGESYQAKKLTPRETVLATLRHEPGRHLVLVRYSPDHSAHDEVVYNRADIDRSDVIWARDMGAAANRELLNYYRDRKIWLLEPEHSLVPQPYQMQ